MRLRSLLLISSIGLGACSTAAPQSSETLGNSTASASNTDGSTEASGPGSTGSNSTDSPSTSLDPTNETGTTAGSTTALSATGEPTTTDTGTGAPSTTEAMSTTGETTLGTTGETGDTTEPDTSGTDGTTGGMGGGPCEVDADCKLHDDCCSCYGIPNDQTDPICKSECDQTQCQQIGIDEAKCVLGQCTTEKVDCSSEVACDSLPPDCPEGTLPGIAGACWSGACVPVSSCDKVPDCKLCPETQMCVEFQAFETSRTCLPLPTDCNGKASCECAGEACAEPFGFCSEGVGDVDLACACPNC